MYSSVAPLIDSSASMEGAMTTAQEAAVGSVESRSARALALDREAFERAIRQATAGGSTSFYDAVTSALKEWSVLTNLRV